MHVGAACKAGRYLAGCQGRICAAESRAWEAACQARSELGCTTSAAWMQARMGACAMLHMRACALAGGRALITGAFLHARLAVSSRWPAGGR
eukprot:CAMPEP_0179365798 /NCGR_PEP_ID=MMETSP0797-20121207/82730_1 /TAXON_ID=47934 /ORGANISM="Dinophysis acuminata, Strain DAEP01" /LENGTH=91 /DNA_ID=CAMNT_0021081299 /DNA_START=313 /DNA_END=584 /DNA_ORIENTATION=-